MSSTYTVLQGVAIGSAAFLSGYMTNFSVIMPGIALAPPHLAAQQWALVFARGIRTAPPLAVLTAIVFGYVSHVSGGLSSAKGQAYALAAATVVAVIPFTLILMAGTNDKLHDAAEKKGEVKESDVAGLLDKWVLLNHIRALFPGVAAAIGFWAAWGF